MRQTVWRVSDVFNPEVCSKKVSYMPDIHSNNVFKFFFDFFAQGFAGTGYSCYLCL